MSFRARPVAIVALTASLAAAVCLADHHELGEGWVPLFNGSDLNNWVQHNGWAHYRIEGDAIVGTTSEGSPNSFLCTVDDYGDFELRFEVKVDNELNSGVQLRSLSMPEYRNGRVHGPQTEIAINGTAGYIYSEGTDRGWLSEDRPDNGQFKPGEWNAYHVIARGDNIKTFVNGIAAADLTDAESPKRGFIGLQVHGIGAGQGPYEVRWRNILIKPLD